MLPVEILDLLGFHTGQLLLDATVLTLLVVHLHPEQGERGNDKNSAGSS